MESHIFIFAKNGFQLFLFVLENEWKLLGQDKSLRLSDIEGDFFSKAVAIFPQTRNHQVIYALSPDSGS